MVIKVYRFLSHTNFYEMTKSQKSSYATIAQHLQPVSLSSDFKILLDFSLNILSIFCGFRAAEEERCKHNEEDRRCDGQHQCHNNSKHRSRYIHRLSLIAINAHDERKQRAQKRSPWCQGELWIKYKSISICYSVVLRSLQQQ